MKRIETLVLVMLAMSASAAVVDVRALALEGQETQWAPIRNFSGLNARAVFPSESRSAASPYTGKNLKTAAGSGEARYYDSKLGTFLSRDSFEGVLLEAPSLHRYTYAHANPLIRRDVDGNAAPLVGAAVGAIGGFALGFGVALVEGKSLKEAAGVGVTVGAAGALIGGTLGAASGPGVAMATAAMMGTGATVGLTGGLMREELASKAEHRKYSASNVLIAAVGGAAASTPGGRAALLPLGVAGTSQGAWELSHAENSDQAALGAFDLFFGALGLKAGTPRWQSHVPIELKSIETTVVEAPQKPDPGAPQATTPAALARPTSQEWWGGETLEAGGRSADMSRPPLRGYFKDLPPVGARQKEPATPAEGWRSVVGPLDLEPRVAHIFAVNESGDLMIAPRGDPSTGQKHTQLTAGARAKAAGELSTTEQGTVLLNRQTGRYSRQSPSAPDRVQQALESLGHTVEQVGGEL